MRIAFWPPICSFPLSSTSGACARSARAARCEQCRYVPEMIAYYMQSSVQVPVNNRHRCGLWTSLADRRSTNRHRPRQSNDRHARMVSWAYEMCVVNDSHRRHSTHHPSIMNGVNGPWSRLSWRGRAMIARRHAAMAIGLAVQIIDGQQLEPCKCCRLHSQSHWQLMRRHCLPYIGHSEL